MIAVWRKGTSPLWTNVVRPCLRSSLPLQQPSLKNSFRKPIQCCFSTETDAKDWIRLDIEEDIGIATMTLQRPPANSLSLEMNEVISDSIQTVEANQKIQALILASGLPSIYSAGLDLTELYQPDLDRLPKFWESFQSVYLRLYGSRLSIISAMNGHALAGGCMLSLSCDYRIMSKGSIGLNESKLGIVAPPWLGQQLIDTVGHRQAELALSLGTSFSPEEALKIGLIDEFIKDQDAVQVAKERAAEWVAIPAQARLSSKQLTRGSQLQTLIANRQQDIDHFCSFVTQDEVQRNLGAYLKHLAKRKK